MPEALKGRHTCVTVCDSGWVRGSVVYSVGSRCMSLGLTLSLLRAMSEESECDGVGASVLLVSDFVVRSGVFTCLSLEVDSVDVLRGKYSLSGSASAEEGGCARSAVGDKSHGARMRCGDESASLMNPFVGTLGAC